MRTSKRDRPAPRRRRAVRSGLLAAHEPVFAGNEWRYLRECLDSGWVSSAGPLVPRFERSVADYVGAQHAVATVSGTAAVHLALCAAGVQPGDEVLVSDLTFIAPVNAIRYCGAHPLLMDADPQTWQLDVDKVADFLRDECEHRNGVAINKRTRRPVRAVVAVHLLGLACEIAPLVAVARRHGLVVIEDAAQATGVRYKGKHVGTFGDLGAFSFNGNKILTAGGGGMVVTNSRRLAQRSRYLATQACDDPVECVHGAVGFNYRLSNLHAAVGLAQLEQLDTFIARKRRIAATYSDAFRGVDSLVPMTAPPHVEATYWLYTVRLGPACTLADRNRVLRRLTASGMAARPLWRPMHALPMNRDCATYRIAHAQRLQVQSLGLPSGAGLDDADVRRCIAAVTAAVGARRHGGASRR